MKNLGKFGKEKEALEASFDYFDETIRVNPSISEVALMDLTEEGMEIKEDDPRALVIIKDYIRSVVHPEDFDKFWAVSRRERQGIQDLMEIAQSLIEAVAERPTGQPQTSSGGRRRTRRKSKHRSSHPAFRVLDGRPDLQESVAMALEARQEDSA